MTLQCNPAKSHVTCSTDLVTSSTDLVSCSTYTVTCITYCITCSTAPVTFAKPYMVGNSLHALFSSADFFFKINFVHFLFKNMIRVSNGLDPYHDCHYVTDILSVLI